MSELKEVKTENDERESQRTVFISYSRSDSSFVKDIAKWLQEAGCTVWQDISGLRGGETWASGIDKAVRGSDVVIVVLSPDSNASEWVRNWRVIEQGSLQFVIAAKARIEMVNISG